MTERLALTQLVEITKSLLAKGDSEGAVKTYAAAEAMIAEEPDVQKAYEKSRSATKDYFDLYRDLATKKFPEAEPTGYEYIGGNKYGKYPEKTLDGYVHAIGDKMVAVDEETHKRIEKTHKDRVTANKTFEDLVTKRHEESGLSKAVEGKGFFIDWYEPSRAQYEKEHGAQASVSATQAGTAKSNQLAV